MTTSLLLIDLNGTVKNATHGGPHINGRDDFTIIPEGYAALERFASVGAIIVGVSNEVGVQAGYKTIGECIDEQVETMQRAPQIRAIFFSPDSDGSRCFTVSPDGSTQCLTTQVLQSMMDGYSVRSFRKPACGMLVAAMFRFNATPENTAMVGDRDEDRTAAISCGIDYMPAEMFYHAFPAGTEPQEENAA